MGVEGCWWVLMGGYGGLLVGVDGGCGGLLVGVDGWVWRVAGGC